VIGGTDIIIPVRNENDALAWAVRAITRLWPNAVLEDADSAEVLPQYPSINFQGRREILAFRDQKAADQWDELGADPSLGGTLVHFLASQGALTVSVDDVPPAQIGSFVEALRSSLRQDIFASDALLEAA
jgi:hypothetical protein